MENHCLIQRPKRFHKLPARGLQVKMCLPSIPFSFLLFSFSRITSSFYLSHAFLSLIMPFIYFHSSLASSFSSFYLSSRHFIFIAWFHLLFHRPFYSFRFSFPFHFITSFLFFLFLPQPSIHSLLPFIIHIYLLIHSSFL